MITMADKQKMIIDGIRDGKSIRSISRKTGFHRKTISKYLKKYNEEKRKMINIGKVSENEIIGDFVSPPKYDSSTRKPRKVSPDIIAEVEYYLQENRKKRSRGEHKQQYSKLDIHQELLNKGYNIGYTTICRYVNKLLETGKETFVKQDYKPGETCEFDWGEIKVFINDKNMKFNMAVFTTAYGSWYYARAFVYQKTRDLMEAHACYFDKIKGVHRTMVYDNMRTAVKRFVGRYEKEPTDALLRISAFYGFKYRFCNIASGNEKGHVEKGVGYIRNKAFVKRNSFNSINELNQYLEQVCDQLNNKPKKGKQGKTANELLQIERAYLFPVQARYDCSEYRNTRVDKLSTICVESCHYSVPEKYTGKIVQVKISTNKLIGFVDNKVICAHDKLIGKEQWSMNIDHYLKTLSRKPGAFSGSVAYQQMDDEIKNIFSRHFKEQVKDFIRLLIYMRDNHISIYEVQKVVEKMERINPRNITSDNIIALMERNIEPKQEYPDNNINESISIQMKELTKLLYDGSPIYEGGEIL